MDRKAIKAEARLKIKGNLWKILWPLLVIGLVSGFLNSILASIFNVNLTVNTSYTTTSSAYSILSSLVSILSTIFTFAYYKYLFNIIRYGEASFNDIIDCIKEKWLNIFLASLLMGVIVGLGFVCLIVPGIILSLAYAFAMFIVIDEDIDAKDALTKSREMLKGYKMDYFVFGLSFAGWIFLSVLTLGILFIWVFPYLMVAEALYYEKLKEISK